MVIKKEETYVLKLTEYREILNVLKTGDEKLVSQLMKDLKDIGSCYKRINNLQDYIFEFVSIFYSYKENSFRAKIRHDKYKDPYILKEFIKLKDFFNQVGIDINVTGSADFKRILNTFSSDTLTKKEKSVKIFDLLKKSVSKVLVSESKNVTQTCTQNKQRFKKLLFNSNINLEYALNDKFFKGVFVDTLEKIIKRDIRNLNENLIVKYDLHNPYKNGELHFILQNKTAAESALKLIDLVKRKGKTVNVGYLYVNNLVDFIGGMLISNTITSLTDEEKFSILSKKIPESCSIRVGSDFATPMRVSNVGFVGVNFQIEKLKAFFNESIKFVNYLKVNNKNQAKVVLSFIFNIFKNNEVMEEELAFNTPEVFAELFKLRYELFGKKKDFTVNPDFYYRINVKNEDSKFSEKLAELEDEFDRVGLNLFVLLDENIKSIWGVDKTYHFNKRIVKLAKQTNSKILVDLLQPHLSFDRLSLFYESTRALSRVMTRDRDSKLCLYLGGTGADIRILDESSVRLFTGNKKATKSVINALGAFTPVDINENKEEDTKMFSSQCLINNLSILTDHFYEPVNKFDPLN